MSHQQSARPAKPARRKKCKQIYQPHRDFWSRNTQTGWRKRIEGQIKTPAERYKEAATLEDFPEFSKTLCKMPSSQTQLMAVRFLSYSMPQHTQLEQGKPHLCVISCNKQQSREQVTKAAKATGFALLTSWSEQTAKRQGKELPCQSNNQLFVRGQKNYF